MVIVDAVILPMKIAIPPSAGVDILWIFLLSGASSKSIDLLTLIMIGSKMNVTVKAVKTDKSMVMRLDDLQV